MGLPPLSSQRQVLRSFPGKSHLVRGKSHIFVYPTHERKEDIEKGARRRRHKSSEIFEHAPPPKNYYRSAKTEMFASQANRNSTDGGTIDGDANKVNSGGPHSVQHQATGGGGGGATATAADAAAGPSAATTTDTPSTSFLDDKTADKCNDTTPEASTAGVAMVATSSSTGATVSSAKSSNDAAVGSSGTTADPSPSTSSSEEWHSASSRLQRTPFSSDENSSSFYATPGTSSTSTTAEAGNRTGTSSGSSTSIELPSTSDDGKMTAPRKRLQWTPPPSAENKVRLRRMVEGDSICNKITT